jgi:trehalose 6-phosphate synthase
VNETLGRINGSLGEPGWVPIHYVTSTYSRAVLAGLYQLARVSLVTPMRDGMNLVSKEYVAAQDPQDPGVLILSKFARAAEELSHALIVIPNDKFEVAEAIQHALHTSQEERVARWQAMLKVLWASDVSRWAAAFVDDWSVTRQAEPAGKWCSARKRAIIARCRTKNAMESVATQPLRRGQCGQIYRLAIDIVCR